MDRAKNPFSAGVGSPPPKLAGRSLILEDAMVALERVKHGRFEKSMILVGLRGVGKTVLLREIQRAAKVKNFKVALVEAQEIKQKVSLPQLLAHHLRRILLELDHEAMVSEKARRALRVFKSFISAFKVKLGGVGFAFDPEIGEGDSGDLDVDLTSLFVALGEAAKDRNTAVAIIIDELQYIDENELSALIRAMHCVAQESLPVLLIGAGLPQLVAKAGDAKSYAERLFAYPKIDALSPSDTIEALQIPVEELAVSFSPEALDEIYKMTKGYPYFLQEWGYHAWNIAATGSGKITLEDVKKASEVAIAHLDESFFRVRFNRLTPTERKYARALAEVGGKTQRSGDIAKKLGKGVEQVAPLRGQLINKGMIYSPEHGHIAFTVPLFEEFLLREIPSFCATDTY